MLLKKLLDLYEKKDLEALRQTLEANPSLATFVLAGPNLSILYPDFMVTCLKILEDIKRNSS